ncbi:MAG TPA: DUF6455 family protein [Burkholderiales bacterium]
MSILSALKEGRLRLAEMLGRRGVKLGEDLNEIRSEALATRRCVFCSTKEQCDAWLASGASEGFARFCPNAELVQRRSSATGR